MHAFRNSASSHPRVKLSGGEAVAFPQGEAWVLGRITPTASEIDVDLAPYGGWKGGVSRRHICIRRVSDGYTLEDLSSANETCLNSERISAGQQYPLAHGDHLVLGEVRCTFLVD